MIEHQPQPNRVFATNWLTVEDLIYSRPDLAEKLNSLDEQQVAEIADQIGERLAETYWLAIDVLLSLKYGEATESE